MGTGGRKQMPADTQVDGSSEQLGSLEGRGRDLESRPVDLLELPCPKLLLLSAHASGLAFKRVVLPTRHPRPGEWKPGSQRPCPCHGRRPRPRLRRKSCTCARGVRPRTHAWQVCPLERRSISPMYLVVLTSVCRAPTLLRCAHRARRGAPCTMRGDARAYCGGVARLQ